MYRKPTFSGYYIRWNSFSQKKEKLVLSKSLFLGHLWFAVKEIRSVLDILKWILIKNGYSENVISACIREKIAKLFLKNDLVL